MSSKMPSVPPENRSPKGTGDAKTGKGEAGGKRVPDNLAEQDRQGNIHLNTHNQGHQQDR